MSGALFAAGQNLDYPRIAHRIERLAVIAVAKVIGDDSFDVKIMRSSAILDRHFAKLWAQGSHLFHSMMRYCSPF